MKIICISDTHGRHRDVEVPDGDVLVHAGDLTRKGELASVVDFNAWLGTLPHRHKIVIAGNHDFCFEDGRREAARAALSNAVYLEDREVVIAGVRFYGTPWQPWFYDWAFNVRSEEERARIWERIPSNTDVLLVHGPPAGYGDLTARGVEAGCQALTRSIQAISPKLVVAGHIHEAYGTYQLASTTILNASSLNLDYEPINPPLHHQI